MLNEHATLAFCLKKGAGQVSVLETVTFLAAQTLVSLRSCNCSGLHSYKSGEAVAAVDAENLSDRSKSVGRIEVALVGGVVLQTPVVLVLVPVRVEIVVICALRVNNLAQKSLTGKLECREFEKVVATILQYDAMLACAL